MSAADELKTAIQLAFAGKRTEAAALLLKIDPQINDPQQRLHLIDVALSTLDPLRDNAKLLELSIEGGDIASRFGLQALQAHFMARRADILESQLGFWRHRRAELKLAPGWVGFATEADRDEYDALTTEIEKRVKEIDNLLTKAEELAVTAGDQKTQGFILMARGSIESSEYLQGLGEAMKSPFLAKLWLRLRLLRHPIFERLFTPRADELKRHRRAFIKSYLEAARILEAIDDSAAASAYHNLANCLRSAYRFRAARKYASKARVIAERHDDTMCLAKLDELEVSIRAKNRDVPDYLSGETRESRRRTVS